MDSESNMNQLSADLTANYYQPTIDSTFHWDAATWQHRISQQTNLGEWSFQHFTNLGVRLYIFCEHSIDTSTSFGEDDIPMISRHLMFFLNCSNHAKSPSDTHGVFYPFLGSTTQDAGSSPPRFSMKTRMLGEVENSKFPTGPFNFPTAGWAPAKYKKHQRSRQWPVHVNGYNGRRRGGRQQEERGPQKRGMFAWRCGEMMCFMGTWCKSIYDEFWLISLEHWKSKHWLVSVDA